MALKWKLILVVIAVLVSLAYALVRREQASTFPNKYKADQKRAMKFMDPSRAWKH